MTEGVLCLPFYNPQTSINIQNIAPKKKPIKIYTHN